MKQERKLTKSERQRRKEKIISLIVLVIVSVIWIFPLIYMLGTSFKSDLDLQTHPETLFPSSWDEWTLEHYTGFIFRDGSIDKMPIWLLNSLWSTLATVAITVLVDLITAYAIVFYRFKGKNFFIRFCILWMAVPTVICTVPSFAMYASVKTALAITSEVARYLYVYMWLILPGVTGIFNLLLMRNFFNSIPHDIIDSAQSDGASHRKIFFKIVCPLAKPTIMLVILFTFTGSWNNLLFPQLLLTGESRFWYTITVALTGYTGSSAWGETGVKMATSVFSLIPIIIIFIITQRRMIEGLASTGVKGA